MSSNKDTIWDLFTAIGALYGIFVIIVGVLFTLMLFLGQPVSQR